MTSDPVTVTGTGLVAHASCSVGKQVIGGGYAADSPSVHAAKSYPDPTGKAWDIDAVITGTTPASITVYAICAQTS
jgi:hypothetical protein